MFANAYLHLETRRIKKNKTFPLKVRVIFQREHHDYKTSFSLTEKEYQESLLLKPKKRFKKLADEISNLRSKVTSIVSNLSVFTFKKFEDIYIGRITESKDLYTLFASYILILETEGRIKTAMSYNSAMISIKEFQSKISIYDVNVSFLKKYQEHQLKKGNSITTVGIYIRSLRSIYNFAISEGIIKKTEDYPFGKRKYIIPAGRNIKKALLLDEVKKIFDFHCIPGTSIDKAKDFWMFSYFCNGINFKDIALLKVSNIDGNMLSFIREKTKLTGQGNRKIISCFLSNQTKSIIEKWSANDLDPEKFLFTILKPEDNLQRQTELIAQFIQNTNKHLKLICKEVGVNKNVTTIWSRHTAATVLKRSGATVSQIQEALGHSSSSITQNYLDSFDTETKMNLALALGTF